jgi:hypothetical protein
MKIKAAETGSLLDLFETSECSARKGLRTFTVTATDAVGTPT